MFRISTHCLGESLRATKNTQKVGPLIGWVEHHTGKNEGGQGNARKGKTFFGAFETSLAYRCGLDFQLYQSYVIAALPECFGNLFVQQQNGAHSDYNPHLEKQACKGAQQGISKCLHELNSSNLFVFSILGCPKSVTQITNSKDISWVMKQEDLLVRIVCVNDDKHAPH
eukprot:403368681